jgi:4-hydroxy-3-polyprenylbenzoate decarboxylase
MIRLANEENLPAPFFQKIKGYPDGYRIFGEALNNHRKIAIAMAMDPNTSPSKLIDEYLVRIKSPIKPVLVSDGPCKENILLGDEIDLLKFPVPMIHEGDGGRYIGTWHLTISRDCASGWVNWGMYRHMLHNKNTIGIQAGPHTHVMRIREGWKAEKKPMEIAIALGVEPVSTFCAATSMPHAVSEVEIAGAIRGEPLELVKCETVDLEVPATAEIVIEGEVAVDELRDEGPFGEFTGYMAGLREPRPVIHVKAITHRNEPILTMGCEGVPSTNSHAIQSIARAAESLELLRSQGLPVTGAYEPIETAQMLMVVAVKAGLGYLADEVAHVIWGSRGGRGTPWVIVVEDDVDPCNLPQVLHALVSKCHPYKGIVRLKHTSGLALHPWLNEHEQKYLLGSKVYFDCTWPADWNRAEVPKRCSFKDIYPSEVQQKASAKWREHGFLPEKS